MASIAGLKNIIAAFSVVACGASDPGAATDTVAFSIRVAPGNVQPGDEGLHCIDVPGPDVDTYVSGWHATRSGAHHVNVWLLAGAHDSLVHSCPGDGKTFVFDTSESVVTTRFGVPGAAMLIPASAWLGIEIHYFNPNADPVAETVAVDFFAVATHTVTVSAISLDGSHAFTVPAHTTAVLGPYRWSPPSDMRLISLIAHQHAHGVWETLSVDGAEVYRSDNWAEPPHTEANIPLTPASVVSWACDVDNTTSAPLRNGNQVNTGEMCSINALGIGPPIMYAAP